MSAAPPPAPLEVNAASAARLHRFHHEAMACEWGVYVAGGERRYARQAADAAFAEVDRLESELSRFIPGSDVSRINQLAERGLITVGLDAMNCLTLAAQMFGLTGGAFDVTLGSAAGQPPLALDPPSRTVCKLVAGARVDLGGIGKGYALDRVIEVLREWEIPTALAHCGQSTVLAYVAAGADTPWNLALRDPRDPAGVLRPITLQGRALAGSGVCIHGEHIVDPRTGQAATRRCGAWSLAPTAALADALSTSFMLMSVDEIATLCQRDASVAALILPRGEGAEPHAINWPYCKPLA